MVKLKINNRELTAKAGMTVLEAASLEGILIPAMCHNGEAGHFTSCMVCLVRERSSPSMIPSCSAVVKEGMDIITEDEEIAEARKTAVELLLSEHIGDCEAPCRIACPANMDIPLMNRYLAAGMTDKALETVMKDIAFPSVLGRICPAPCEGACHRKGIDEPVAVCTLKRFSGDKGNFSVTQAALKEGKVAIIGAGIAGLSAAYYLQVKGISCTIFDSNPLPGGSIRYKIDDKTLDKEILAKETDFVFSSGVTFHADATIDKTRFMELTSQYDAVVVATGNLSKDTAEWGLQNNGKQVTVNKQTYQTNITNVFAIGNVNRSTRLAIRSAAQGKEVAFSIEQKLEGSEPAGEHKQFNSRIGQLREVEHKFYMEEASGEKRLKPLEKNNGAYTPEEAAREAARCMHCECLKPANCTLRILAERFGASRRRFGFEERKNIKKNTDHNLVTYEPGKCIKCGICVRLAAAYGERPGLTFIGRGYDVEIAVPFEESLKEAVKKVGLLVAEACPTGALATRKDKNPDKQVL